MDFYLFLFFSLPLAGLLGAIVMFMKRGTTALIHPHHHA